MQELSDVLGNRYEFLETLGSGGIATVIKAHDKHLDSIVAIKILQKQHLSEKDFVRFQNEAKISAKLDHENIIKVMDFGMSPSGSPYMVMEYLEGKTLREHIQEGYEFQEEELGALTLQITEGLKHAHEKSVIHSDLTPGNIVLMESDVGEWLVKLIDFGTAFLKKRDTSGFSINVSGAVAGTPSYMSPEQCKGANPDQRSDIYSLGCILFEVVEGRKLFTADSVAELCAKHVNETAPAAENTTFLKPIIARCLSKDPVERYANVNDLQESIHESFSLNTDTSRSHIQKQKISPKKLFTIAAILTLLFSASFGVSKFQETFFETEKKQLQRLIKKANKEKDPVKKLEYLTQAVTLAPDSYELRMRRGKLYANDENYNFALSDFQKALSASPRSYETIEIITTCYKRMENYGVRKAIEFLMEELEKFPDFEKLYDLVINIIRDQQFKLKKHKIISEERYDAYNNDKMLASFLEKLSSDIQDKKLKKKVTKYARDLRRLEAFNIYKMYQFDPKHPWIAGTLMPMADDYTKNCTEKNMSSELAKYTRQIEDNPRNTEALYFRADGYYKLGKIKLALKDLKQFIEYTDSEERMFFAACLTSCLAKLSGEEFSLRKYIKEDTQLFRKQKHLVNYILGETRTEPVLLPETTNEMVKLSPLDVRLMAFTGLKLGVDGQTDKAIRYLLIPAYSEIDKPSRGFSYPFLVRLIYRKFTRQDL